LRLSTSSRNLAAPVALSAKEKAMDERIRNEVPEEPGPQPDPMLNEGPASKTRTLAVTAVIAAVLLAVMYGVTAYRVEVKDEQRQSHMQREPNPASAEPLPGGRTTAGAPTSPNASKPGG
jgi:hypothetical protein